MQEKSFTSNLLTCSRHFDKRSGSPLAYGNDNNNDTRVINLVDEAVSGILQLYFVAISKSSQARRLDPRPLEPFCQFLL